MRSDHVERDGADAVDLPKRRQLRAETMKRFPPRRLTKPPTTKKKASGHDASDAGEGAGVPRRPAVKRSHQRRRVKSTSSTTSRSKQTVTMMMIGQGDHVEVVGDAVPPNHNARKRGLPRTSMPKIAPPAKQILTAGTMKRNAHVDGVDVAEGGPANQQVTRRPANSRQAMTPLRKATTKTRNSALRAEEADEDTVDRNQIATIE
jgi:hypothetical protein